MKFQNLSLICNGRTSPKQYDFNVFKVWDIKIKELDGDYKYFSLISRTWVLLIVKC